MKKTIFALAIMLPTAVLVALFSGPAMAKVSGRCDNCHTMHNSQGGTAMAEDRSSWYGSSPELGTPPYGTLLTDTCVGCHSHPSAVTYELAGCTVPVVWTRDSEPATYLAGGNFYWVHQSGGDTNGHNVLGIADVDTNLTTAPGGDYVTCDTPNCHETLAQKHGVGSMPKLGSGCQGCHLAPAHHANDHPNGESGLVDSADKGWYRFLSGHEAGDGYGVEGFEHGEWENGHPNLPVGQSTNHNEYLGYIVRFDRRAGLSDADTTTAYCCGCHGDFHVENENDLGTGNWIRHPSDAKLPDEGEYLLYTSYNPLAPVARPAVTGSAIGTVQPGTDMVMCLSCHRPHGSPYDDLLRWKYTGVGGCEAQGTSKCGCFVCHTQKGTYE